MQGNSIRSATGGVWAFKIPILGTPIRTAVCGKAYATKSSSQALIAQRTFKPKNAMGTELIYDDDVGFLHHHRFVVT